MENEEIFEADTEAARTHPVPAHRSRRLEHHDADATSGGSGKGNDTNTEVTPLLSGGSRDDDDTGATENDSGGNGPDSPSWSGERDFEGLPWYRRPSIFWLLPGFFIFAMAFGGTIVPKVNLILAFICRDYFQDRSMKDPSFHSIPVLPGADNPQCRIPEVQSLVSKFTLYGSLISGLLSAFTSPKLGALSDRYGRTRLMSLCTIGMLIMELIFILVATYPETFSVPWILVGFVFDGLGGSFIAAMALSYAYASDCTAPGNRNVAFGYYHGCLFFGIALGPLFAGYVVKATGQILSIFYIATAIHGAFFLFLLLICPESLTKERQHAARMEKRFADDGDSVALASADPSTVSFAFLRGKLLRGKNPLAPLAVLWPTGPGTGLVRRNLVFLAAVDATMFGVAMGSMTIILIYSNYMFGWDNFQSSIFVSIINCSRVAVLLIVLPVVTRLVRGPAKESARKNVGCDMLDLSIIRLAVLFDLLGFVGYALVRTGTLFILCGAFAAIGGMGSPTLQSSLTKHVPPSQTGRVLGAMGFLHALGRVIAPTIFNLIYAATVKGYPQAVFICLSATFGLAFIFSWFIRPHIYWATPGAKAVDNSGSDDGTDGVHTA